MAELIIGLILGALVSYLAQNFASIRSMQIEQLNSHINTLDRIEELSTSYWLADQDCYSSVLRGTEARINGQWSAFNCFEPHAVKLLGDQYAKYRDLSGKLFDFITAGEYETARRELEKERTQQIVACCAELRSLLTTGRIRMFWAH